MVNRVLFFSLIAFIGMIAGLLQWQIYRRPFPLLRHRIFLISLLILPWTFVLSHLAIAYLPPFLTRTLAWIGGYWLFMTCYSLMWLVVYGAGYMFCKAWCQKSSWILWSRRIAGVGITVIVLAAVIGTWNAFHPVYRDIFMTTNRPLSKEYTVAFVSDIHLSPILGRNFSQELANRLNALQPDVILLGGDIIDGNLPFVTADGSYEGLTTLSAPLGVYAVYGNHDYFNSAVNEEAALFSPIRFLKNEQIVLDDTLQLTGLNDYLHEPRKEVPVPDKDYVTILLDHEPYRICSAAQAGYDLYLAGHTHGGQFFPNTIITEKMYLLDHGSHSFGSLLAVVTNGYGFWGPPIRLGAPPEIVIVHIKHDA
jgi:predicted MPP superfamily phosphohydrolase